MEIESQLQLIECPRDAMQGLHEFIPTEVKAGYLNQLLKVGFHSIDFGSFVSPKAIPQLRDTAEVLDLLDLSSTKSKLLAIIANQRGAESAVQFKQIDYLGYPLSLSETFQQRNTNRSIAQAFEDLALIQELCLINNKQLVVYLSMGFGNPYGDPYNADYLEEYVDQLNKMGVTIVSLADTIGISNTENIGLAFERLISAFPEIVFGAHLHSRPDQVAEKTKAAYDAGCRRFDSALKGFGGCPMADDDLVGNMATEIMVQYLTSIGIETKLNAEELQSALNMTNAVFPLK